MVRVSVVLALSVLDIAVPSGARAAASTPANIPTPGEIQSTLPVTPPPPQFKSAPLTATPPPTAPADIAPGGPTVVAQHFVIEGNSVYSDAVLQALIADSLGKPLTLAELYKVADVLTRYYQSHGYTLARATIPEQQLDQGVVKFQVVEGRVGKLHVEGNTRIRTATVMKQASDLKPGQVFDDTTLNRSVLLVNDLPGVQAQAVLEPGESFGSADVLYKIQEGPAYTGQISVDNYGHTNVGRSRLNAALNLFDLSSFGDSLSANLTHTDHNLLNFGGLNYSLPVGAPGGRLNAGYSQSEYRVLEGLPLSRLGLSGNSKNANLSYQYPLIRERDESFYWGFGLQHAQSVSLSHIVPDGKKIPVAAELSNDNLNTLQLTGFYNRSWEDGSYWTLSGSFTSNLRRDHGNDSGAELARLQLTAAYVTPFAGDWNLWSFSARSEGVWSPDPLADTEKYSLGGPDNVRAFESAEARGDEGLFASVELQRSLAPAWPLAVGWFVDSGKVWTRSFQIGSSPLSPSDKDSLSSVGAELIFQSPGKSWEARLQWAYPVGGYKPAAGTDGGKIWATLGMNF